MAHPPPLPLNREYLPGAHSRDYAYSLCNRSARAPPSSHFRPHSIPLVPIPENRSSHPCSPPYRPRHLRLFEPRPVDFTIIRVSDVPALPLRSTAAPREIDGKLRLTPQATLECMHAFLRDCLRRYGSGGDEGLPRSVRMCLSVEIEGVEREVTPRNWAYIRRQLGTGRGRLLLRWAVMRNERCCLDVVWRLLRAVGVRVAGNYAGKEVEREDEEEESCALK